MDDVTPWVEPVHSSEVIREIVNRGVPTDMSRGLGGKVLEMARLYRHYLDDYPPLREHVHIFPCDTEGSPGTAHQLWEEKSISRCTMNPTGSCAAEVIAETTIAFTKRFKEISGEPLDLAYHFYYRVPGGVRIVDDVAVNLSAAMYEEFFVPTTNASLRLRRRVHALLRRPSPLSPPEAQDPGAAGHRAWL